MADIINDFNSGIIIIKDTYDINDFVPIIGTMSPNNEYIMSFVNLERVKRFESFTYSSSGEIETRFLETYFRVSRNGTNYTEWFDLNNSITNFPPFDPLDNMWIDIKWKRSGSKLDGDIVKLEQWELFKAVNDKWVSGRDTKNRLLFDEFLFFDRANRDIGDELIINTDTIRKFCC